MREVWTLDRERSYHSNAYQNNYGELLSLVNEYHESDTNMTEREVKERIQEYFEDDSIDGSQYDHLIGLLDS